MAEKNTQELRKRKPSAISTELQQDSEDEIIAKSASLKEGVAKRLVENSTAADGAFFKLQPEIAKSVAAELSGILGAAVGEGSPREGVPLVESGSGHFVALALAVRDLFGDEVTPELLLRVSENWQVWGVSEGKIAAFSALDAALAHAPEIEYARTSFTAPLLPRLKTLGTSRPGRGELLKVTCGHNGQLSPEEASQLAEVLKRLMIA